MRRTQTRNWGGVKSDRLTLGSLLGLEALQQRIPDFVVTDLKRLVKIRNSAVHPDGKTLGSSDRALAQKCLYEFRGWFLGAYLVSESVAAQTVTVAPSDVQDDVVGTVFMDRLRERDVLGIAKSGRLVVRGNCTPSDLQKLFGMLHKLQEQDGRILIDLDLSAVSGLIYIDGFSRIVERRIPGTYRVSKERMRFGLWLLRSMVLPPTVVRINDYAFAGWTNLEKIVLQEKITKIGNYAFWQCSELKSIVIPESVTQIGDFAFADCTSLKKATLPKALKTIEKNTFRNCSALESIVIPEGVTEIAANAFAECTALKEVSLPKTLKTIGKRAFSGCNKLGSIVIPEGVTQIDNAFAGCTSLKEITLPKTLKYFSYGASSNCRKLENIVIPEGVTRIAADAFEGCTSLKEVTLPTALKNIGGGVFSNCSKLESIVIPEGVTESEGEGFFPPPLPSSF